MWGFLYCSPHQHTLLLNKHNQTNLVAAGSRTPTDPHIPPIQQPPPPEVVQPPPPPPPMMAAEPKMQPSERDADGFPHGWFFDRRSWGFHRSLDREHGFLLEAGEIHLDPQASAERACAEPCQSRHHAVRRRHRVNACPAREQPCRPRLIKSRSGRVTGFSSSGTGSRAPSSGSPSVIRNSTRRPPCSLSGYSPSGASVSKSPPSMSGRPAGILSPHRPP